MARSAHLPIAADRYEDCVRKIVFRGLDLRGSVLRAQARLSRGTPGEPLFDLATVDLPGAQGLRIADFSTDGIVPVTTVELIVGKTAMAALPYAGELGDDTLLAYDLSATIEGRERKVLWGEFAVIDGVIGADDAPAFRPPSFTGGRSSAPWSSAVVTFDHDAAEVTIDGVDLIDPLFGELFVREAARRALIVARANLYGIVDDGAAELFAAESVELDFAHDFYRTGFVELAEATDLQGWEYTGEGPFIGGSGLRVEGANAPAIKRPPYGDFTVVIEADLLAQDATNDYLVSIVGSTLDSNIQAYRTDTGYFALSVNDSGNLGQAIGILDPSARRVRAAVTCTGGEVRACFAGGDVLVVGMPRPLDLLRFWLGRPALGVGEGIGGNIRLATIRQRASTDAELKAMTSAAPIGQTPGADSQAVTSHNQDSDAHDLAAIRTRMAYLEGQTGTWTLRAADTFSGDPGVITTTEVGALVYHGWINDTTLPSRRAGGTVGSPNGQGTKGAYVEAGFADGQVEARLIPGTDQARLFVRYQDETHHLLVIRVSDGAVLLSKNVNDILTNLAPPVYRPVVANERFKARFVGNRLWVIRAVGAAEEVLFAVEDATYVDQTRHGFQMLGTGTVDDFRIKAREAL